MNKFEHISSDGHQMSLPGFGVGGPMSDGESHIWCTGGGGEVHCTIGNVTWDPSSLLVDRMMDGLNWKYYNPATSLANGNNF